MANVTDPSVAAVSGTDPQSLLEYITRTKIYETRYWKEECFGLTVSDVLQKAATQLTCIGNLPTKFLSLLLKLLQLHPENDLIVETFCQQEQFKYVRLLGCFYLRLMIGGGGGQGGHANVQQLYQTLEPFYQDGRKVRVWNTFTQLWSIRHVDEIIHDLLTKPIVLEITLPRLPTRKVLQEEGYLEEDELRPTALHDVLVQYCKQEEDANQEEDDNDTNKAIAYDPVLKKWGEAALAYLQHKALAEKCPSAMKYWEERQQSHPTEVPPKDDRKAAKRPRSPSDSNVDKDEDGNNEGERKKSKKKKRKKEKVSYDNLFKKSSSSASKTTSHPTSKDNEGVPEEHDEDYWNEQRSKLGLAPLRK